MFRRIILIFTAATMLAVSCFAAPEVDAPSCLLMDAATGTILYEKNPDEPLAPASVTKVMTLLLVMEAVERGQLGWVDTITASASAAAKGGSQVYLEEGEQMPLHEMIKCVVVSSANDCATALAEAVSGSETEFVELMNRRAKELGMNGTHFANCTGLDDNAGPDVHYTTARDIAVMSQELLRHDKIREFTTIWMDTIRDGTFGLSNTNKLVRFYQGTTGLKTGFTSSAGYCMSATAIREDMELIAVVMHCSTSTQRFESAKALLDYGFASYTLLDPLADTTISPVAVELGQQETIIPVPESTAPLLLEKSRIGSVSCEVQLSPLVSAPVLQGQTLGSVIVRSGDQVIGEVPLVAAEAVPRLTWGQLFFRLLNRLWMGE